jgi:hypothetical protein
MKKTQRQIKKTKKYSWYYLLVMILIFITGAITSYLYLKPKFTFKSPFIESIEAQRHRAKSRESETLTKDEKNSLRLYKSPPTEERKGILRSEQPENNNELKKELLLVTAEDVIKKYMQSYGVKLLDLYMGKNGTIYADFSDELRKKFYGDASDEYQIIAGLYKSIRANIPDFNSLKILIDGKEVESFGGHIDISRPIGEAIEKSEGEKIEDTI